jgi:hypothetical protein
MDDNICIFLVSLCVCRLGLLHPRLTLYPKSLHVFGVLGNWAAKPYRLCVLGVSSDALKSLSEIGPKLIYPNQNNTQITR